MFKGLPPWWCFLNVLPLCQVLNSAKSDNLHMHNKIIISLLMNSGKREFKTCLHITNHVQSTIGEDECPNERIILTCMSQGIFRTLHYPIWWHMHIGTWMPAQPKENPFLLEPLQPPTSHRWPLTWSSYEDSLDMCIFFHAPLVKSRNASWTTPPSKAW